MRIKDVAKLLGVSTAMLRRLEARGLIKSPQRDLNDQRRYTVQDVEAIRKVVFKTDAPVAEPGAKLSPRANRVNEFVERMKARRKK